MDIKHVLKEHAYRNIPLTYAEAYALGKYALEGCRGDSLAMIQSIAALSALHTQATYRYRGPVTDCSPANAAEQIAGICAAIFEHDIGKSESGFLTPNVPFVMDNCGMGGDLTVTANVSTISALIVASLGIHMCKHGSPANADGGRHGSSDFVALCGINEYGSRREVEQLIEQYCFGYTEALDKRFKLIHTQTHQVACMPHMNDLIGPITNPVSPSLLSRRVIGVNHLIEPAIIAEAYRILNERRITNMRHLFAVRGYGDDGESSGGMDELSICAGGTVVAELRNGRIETYRLYAADFGVEPVLASEISPPSGMSKGEFSLGILRGSIRSPVVRMICANAALLVRLAKPNLPFPACYELAHGALASGNAYQCMRDVQAAHPKS